ncbi:MAG: hypothetical protein KDD69_09905 [Bdellovibrionales bacterium]|nr:hypothetical protein [Bdellovibrionales bacterium]
MATSDGRYPALDFLKTLPLWDGTRFSPLEVPRRLLALLGNPQDRVPAVHVGGTNGKGSTCAYLAAMLRASGANVGQFVSPHLTHVTERCLLNGLPCPVQTFNDAVQEVIDLTEREGLPASYFVLGAVATFLVFARAELDWMVIEVGLGGTFDATNTMKVPRACVVTSIGMDHMDWLGTSLAEIAENKAGIARRDVPLFVGHLPQEALKAVRWSARRIGAPLELPKDDGAISELTTDIAVPYLRQNAKLAAQVALALGLPLDAVRRGIRTARWPGRAERVVLRCATGVDREVLLDAAHNPDGVDVLVDHLETLSVTFSRFVIVVGMLSRKDWQGMAERLRAFGSRHEVTWIVSPIDSHLSLAPRTLCELLPNAAVAVSAADALAQAVAAADENTLIVVAGSIYLLGEVRPLVTEEPFRSIVEL